MSQKPPAGREDVDREAELAISHARAYTAPGVRVFYDRGRCLHFAECIRGLPQVFDVAKRTWIQPQNASADEVAEVVRRCPSGALHYRLEEGPPEQPEQPTRVEFVSNGPINLRGDLSIEVSAGRMREVRTSGERSKEVESNDRVRCVRASERPRRGWHEGLRREGNHNSCGEGRGRISRLRQHLHPPAVLAGGGRPAREHRDLPVPRLGV